jgi:argininosuccinate lyase
MLAEQGIVEADAAARLRAALDDLDLDAVRRAPYDPAAEDLFFHLEHRLAAACGPDLAGRLHTARSRNDIDMTMYRMTLRYQVLQLVGLAVEARRTLASLAGRHRETVFAAHTHTQPAQPTTVAHYLLAVIEGLERDTRRLLAAYATTNRCPLGACAITGTGFPIARDRTSALLGFDAPTGNTYGSIAAIDYLLESAAAASTLVVGLGRFVQDLLLWCTAEVGYLRLSDGFVQVSSIMPQKRNPVALEHARALASKAYAQLSSIAAVVHNTPFGDIVDTEDDLQPLVAAGFRDARRALELTSAALASAELDVARMRSRAAANWVTATELADTMARDHGLPFMTAHQLVSSLTREGGPIAAGAIAARLNDAIARAGFPVRLAEADVARALGAEHFVAVRRTPGGPAPELTAAALDTARGHIEADAALAAAAWERLRAADQQRWGPQGVIR